MVEKGTPGFDRQEEEQDRAAGGAERAHHPERRAGSPETNRLQRDSFKDTAEVLRLTRAGVAWQAAGCAIGAYEPALAYAHEREQFGNPIASFQLVQDLLVKMLANITSSACLCARLSELQHRRHRRRTPSALAKAFCTVRMRETVGRARELLGGNGILLENNVAAGSSPTPRRSTPTRAPAKSTR